MSLLERREMLKWEEKTNKTERKVVRKTINQRKLITKGRIMSFN
jgi:hypothetical protein